MVIKKAEFVKSVVGMDQIPESRFEIAIVGKSNVGKSSFINYLCNRKNLARTSKDPGRTRMLNYFDCNDGEFTLVDLPGYGYAKVSKEEKMKWAKIIEEYFHESKNLKNVFMLVDIRNNPSKEDIIMINYLYDFQVPFTIIATKIDKLSRSAMYQKKSELAKFLKVGIDNIYLIY